MGGVMEREGMHGKRGGLQGGGSNWLKLLCRGWLILPLRVLNRGYSSILLLDGRNPSIMLDGRNPSIMGLCL